MNSDNNTNKEFDRLISGIGIDLFNKLKNSSVAIIGLGGVGGYALESIVRSGISNIIIMDYDIIEVSNINRQIIALNSTLGNKKTLAFKERLLDINPNLNLEVIDEKFSEETKKLLFNNNIKIDYLIDAIDDIKAKKILIKYCLDNNIDFISSMGMAKRFDPTKIEITNLRKTYNDPIAKILRKEFKDFKVVCSTEVPIESKTLVSNSIVPSVAGIYLASYIINKILKG